MLIDYHMHTRLTDGTGEPVDYARVALERGLDENRLLGPRTAWQSRH